MTLLINPEDVAVLENVGDLQKHGWHFGLH